MRILQIIYESLDSPFGFGGAGVRAYETYKRLLGRHEITLLCMKYPGARDGEIEGLRHIFLGIESSSLVRSVFAYTLRASQYVRRHGREFDVIVENFLPTTPFFSCLLTKTPVILQVQGIMESHSFRKFNPLLSSAVYLVEAIYPSLYRDFIFVSDVTMKKTLRKNLSGRICKVIPNGIDRDMLETVSVDKGYLLFLSRIDTYTKGLDILIRAFEVIGAAFPELELVLAGYEFDNAAELISRCPLGVRERVRYAGFVKGDEKRRLLSGAKIFILPSRHESSPVSILEAAACGKPVIVSDIEELAFVEANRIGLSFASGSVDSLITAITILINDEAKRVEMGNAGRTYASRFLWDNTAEDFEQTLISLVERYQD